jgi:hypothetical protein
MGCESRAKRRPDRITERHGEAVKEGEVVGGEREKSREEDELGKEGYVGVICGQRRWSGGRRSSPAWGWLAGP